MQNDHSKKLQSFRREIRREQIESYKKNRRKQLMMLENSSQLSQTYWGVLRQHQLANLKEMSYQRLQCHMQMLVELVFCQQSHLFIDALEKIMVVLVDYYEEALHNWMNVARNDLERVAMDEIDAVDCIDIYAMTKVFSFIPANRFFKVLGGIYHDIVPSRNMEYLRKIVAILKSTLHFSFAEHVRIENLISFIEPGLDFQLNDTIEKHFILNTLMNIAYSEEEAVVRVIVQQGVFDVIMEKIETRGLQGQTYEFLAGLYGNCLGYMCNTFANHPASRDQEQYEDYGLEGMDSYYLYIPIFQHLVNANLNEANPLLVSIACQLLEVSAEKSNLREKEFILDSAQFLARNIITTKEYYEETERLFILCAKQFNFEKGPYPLWLLQLLSLILTNHSMVYFGQSIRQGKTKIKSDKVDRGKVLKEINQIIVTSRMLLQRCDANFLQFQQSLVECIVQFWCKEDFAMGSLELLHFMRAALDCSKELSAFIMFDRYEHEFICVLNGDYDQLEETRALLELLNSACNRLQQANLQQVSQYMGRNEAEWSNIFTRLQGHSHTHKLIEEYYFKLAETVYDRVEKLQKEAAHV